MTLSKKPVAKKRGRPPGSKNKTSAAKVRAWDKNNILEENNAVWDELKKVSAQSKFFKYSKIAI